jgi:hypothetical protein
MPVTSEPYPRLRPDEEPDGPEQGRHVWRWVLGIAALLLVLLVVLAATSFGIAMSTLSHQLGTDNLPSGPLPAPPPTSYSAVVRDCQDQFRTVQTARDQFRAGVGFYLGGSAPGVKVHPDTTYSDYIHDGILVLMGKVTVRDGVTLGPWLQFVPGGRGFDFRIGLSNDGRGTITVLADRVFGTELGTTPAACDLLP